MFNKRAQTTIEYAVLMIIIMAALLTIGNYFKRGVQGRWKESVDGLGDQYDPQFMTTDITHSLAGNSTTRVTAVNAVGGFRTLRDDQSAFIESKTGASRVDAP